MATTKVHLTFPPEIIEEIDKLVSKRRRSKFVAEATREKINREKFQKALRECAGAWKPENHPDLATTQDVIDFVDNIRKESEERLKRIYNE
ncbi:MAG: ribbon-helix-helix domain-containing protein [Actinobacteria bacterium]|nr:ribbon-helix-helix domain-containing protein [Actinomycetota bacterium]